VSPAAGLAAAPASRSLPLEFRHVLAGVMLDGPAARLAGMLDPEFLAEAGWDPASRVLSLPAGHRLLGRTLCRADGCPATAHGTKAGGLCWSCFARLRRAGMSAEQIAALPGCRRRRRARPGAWCRGASGCPPAAGRGSGPGCAWRIRGGSAASRG
jgi:hypothetical protein